MIDKMIKRYVKEVCEYLPILDRRQARQILTATIYERLNEYTNGLRPIRKDVKHVLREFGKPGKVARAYYRDFHIPFRERLNIKSIQEHMLQVISVLALLLVGIGIAQLLLGHSNIACLVIGAFIGVVVQFNQVVNQSREESFIFTVPDSAK